MTCCCTTHKGWGVRASHRASSPALQATQRPTGSGLSGRKEGPTNAASQTNQPHPPLWHPALTESCGPCGSPEPARRGCSQLLLSRWACSSGSPGTRLLRCPQRRQCCPSCPLQGCGSPGVPLSHPGIQPPAPAPQPGRASLNPPSPPFQAAAGPSPPNSPHQCLLTFPVCPPKPHHLRSLPLPVHPVHPIAPSQALSPRHPLLSPPPA